ncbi:hypothetical protein K503DRAFT_788220, partial [Rhizopogon vinicolor AM-OR11-026]
KTKGSAKRTRVSRLRRNALGRKNSEGWRKRGKLLRRRRRRLEEEEDLRRKEAEELKRREQEIKIGGGEETERGGRTSEAGPEQRAAEEWRRQEELDNELARREQAHEEVSERRCEEEHRRRVEGTSIYLSSFQGDGTGIPGRHARGVPILKRIYELRKRELRGVRRILHSSSANLAVATSLPALAAKLAFITCTLTAHEFDVAIILSSLSPSQVTRESSRPLHCNGHGRDSQRLKVVGVPYSSLP